jgi:hypothetical protein
MAIATPLGGTPTGGEPIVIANGGIWCFVIYPQGHATLYEIFDTGSSGFKASWTIKGFKAMADAINIAPNAEGLVWHHEIHVVDSKTEADIGEQPVFDFFAKGKLLKRWHLKDIVPDVHTLRIVPRNTESSGGNDRMVLFGDDESRKCLSFDEATALIGKEPKANLSPEDKNWSYYFIFDTSQNERLVFSMQDGSLVTRLKVTSHPK